MLQSGSLDLPSKCHIRAETPQDSSGIERVHIAAFANHPFSHQTEHLIVKALRADDALAVSLVAEADGKIIGHIAFSRIRISGAECRWFLLGPVGVLPDQQRKGIGIELVRQGLEEIRRLGADGCVLVGDPAYYSRFGFTQTNGLTVEGVPPQYCLWLPMSESSPRGTVEHHAAFSVTA